MTRQRFAFAFQTPPARRRATLASRASGGLESVAGSSADLTCLCPHDPRLSPRDEADYLLHAVAEVEHALMVQYLYAAYSLNKEGPGLSQAQKKKIREWKSTLIQIAVEEMGHLASAQNLLRLLGGPINFEREDFPFRGGLYPFPFRLEPVTLRSLAKYVAAERPAVIADPDTARLYSEVIEPLARDSNEDQPVNRVGALFLRLRLLLGDKAANPAAMPGDEVLKPEDFQTDVAAYLAGDEFAWPDVLIGPPRDQVTDPRKAQAAAIAIVKAIAEQGEGYDTPSDGESHFDRFVQLFRDYRETFPTAASDDVGPSTPTWPAPRDPTTSGQGASTITHPRSRGWAHLLNVRYRMLLNYLTNYFSTADESHRTLLVGWIFEEMTEFVRECANRLVGLPRHVADLPDRAGPPFELPYTLSLPDRAVERWRSHRDVVDNARFVIESLIEKERQATGAEGPFLKDLLERDAQRREKLSELMKDSVPQPGEGSTSGSSGGAASAKDNMLKLIAFLKAAPHNAATRHGGVELPSGGTLNDLFDDPEKLLEHLRTQTVINDAVEQGKPLVVAGKPDDSAFVRLIQKPPMKSRFAFAVPGTSPGAGAADLTGVEVVRGWILSLT